MVAPRFPFVPWPTHTLLSEEQCAEYGPNELGTTVLGETINNSDFVPDSLFVFDPVCTEQSSGVFKFHEVLPGEHNFSEYRSTPDRNQVRLYDLQSQVVRDLVAAGRPFQFVAAPGTDREQRYRVKPGGALQRIGGPSFCQFSLGVETNRGAGRDLFLQTRAQGVETVRWLHDDEPTGEFSKAKLATVTRAALEQLRDIFYALNFLDAETMATYGRVIGLCAVCGRELADAQSLNRGIGPSCLKRLQEATS